MHGHLLDHLQRIVVMLYCDMSSINIPLEFFKAKTDREVFSLYIGISGLNVSKCFTSKGYGLILFWMGAVLRPYSLALVCRTRGAV